MIIPAGARPEDDSFPKFGGNLWPDMRAGLSDDQHVKAGDGAAEFACQDCGTGYAS